MNVAWGFAVVVGYPYGFRNDDPVIGMLPDALIWYPTGQVCKFDTGSQVPSIFLWYPIGQLGNDCPPSWIYVGCRERGKKQYHDNQSNTAYGHNHLH